MAPPWAVSGRTESIIAARAFLVARPTNRRRCREGKDERCNSKEEIRMGNNFRLSEGSHMMLTGCSPCPHRQRKAPGLWRFGLRIFRLTAAAREVDARTFTAHP